jgi:hypothetical protein
MSYLNEHDSCHIWRQVRMSMRKGDFPTQLAFGKFVESKTGMTGVSQMNATAL